MELHDVSTADRISLACRDTPWHACCAFHCYCVEHWWCKVSCTGCVYYYLKRLKRLDACLVCYWNLTVKQTCAKCRGEIASHGFVTDGNGGVGLRFAIAAEAIHCIRLVLLV